MSAALFLREYLAFGQILGAVLVIGAIVLLQVTTGARTDPRTRSLRMLRSSRRTEKIRQVLARRQPGLTVVMENIHDPHNVSAVFRTCDAVGVMQVELLYTVEKFPRIGKKSSSSANKWLERRRHTSVDECFRILRDEGFRIYATHLGRKPYRCTIWI